MNILVLKQIYFTQAIFMVWLRVDLMQFKLDLHSPIIFMPVELNMMLVIFLNEFSVFTSTLGEEAHWTPFQIASVDYIRKTYPTWATDGRDSDGAGLVAFTFGVTSHYITDINWHGLEVIPSGEGLIRTMGIKFLFPDLTLLGYADFNCTDGDLCGVAHSAADTGGEFAGAASLDLSWFPAVIISISSLLIIS